ncbi:unnamed protein product [Camellia sinensis]
MLLSLRRMATTVKLMLVTCILATWAVLAVNSTMQPMQSPAPAPSVDCTDLMYDMFSCLSYLTVGNNDTKPGDSCCAGLKTVIDTDADCLCKGLKASSGLGFNINFKKAKAIPSVCNIPTPPSLTSCDSSSSDASPAPSPPSTPSTPPANPPPSIPPPETTPSPPTIEPGAPAPSVDCSDLIYDMIDCLTYLTVGNNDTKPADLCCTGLKTVLDTDADCLCKGLESSASLGFNIDFKKAKAIPSVCNIPTPPSLTSCDLASSGSPPPAVPSPPSAPSTPPVSPATPPPISPPPKTSPPPPTTEPGAPAPSVDCTTLIYGMSDCLTYLTVGSNETKPEDTCCTGLKTVLDTDADCLCEGLKSSASLGFNIDFKKAKAIPSVCKIPTPPSLTSCDLTSSPSTPGAPSPPVAKVPPPATSQGGKVSDAPAPSPVTNSGAYAMTYSRFSMVVVPFLYILA